MSDVKKTLVHMINDHMRYRTIPQSPAATAPFAQGSHSGKGEDFADELAGTLIASGVEVPVRCVRCKHWAENDDGRPDYGLCFRRGFKRGEWVRANGYCDRGVPKE